MRSSIRPGRAFFRIPCIPELSNWNAPVLLPSQNILNVAGSFSGMDFSSMGTPFLRTRARASSMTVSVFRPRKSIFTRPHSSR